MADDAVDRLEIVLETVDTDPDGCNVEELPKVEVESRVVKVELFDGVASDEAFAVGAIELLLLSARLRLDAVTVIETPLELVDDFDGFCSASDVETPCSVAGTGMMVVPL